MFEIFSGKRSVKNVVLLLLNKHGILGVKALHSFVKSDYHMNVSYQSVHKAVNQLVERHILVKVKDGYRLSEIWFNKLKHFVEDHTRGISIQGAKDLKEDGDVQTIYFSSLERLGLYRLALQIQHLS